MTSRAASAFLFGGGGKVCACVVRGGGTEGVRDCREGKKLIRAVWEMRAWGGMGRWTNARGLFVGEKPTA